MYFKSAKTFLKFSKFLCILLMFKYNFEKFLLGETSRKVWTFSGTINKAFNNDVIEI